MAALSHSVSVAANLGKLENRLLLSIFSSIINEENKYLSRNYIAYGYFIMGIVQISIILFISKDSFSLFKWYYLIIPCCIFFPCQNIFKIINNELFIKVIYYLAFLYGCISFMLSIK